MPIRYIVNGGNEIYINKSDVIALIDQEMIMSPSDEKDEVLMVLRDKLEEL